jgi:hypothetical protein
MTVIFKGDWDAVDYAAAQAGIALVAAKLATITGGMPEDAFRCLLGEVTFEAVARCPGNWHAYVAPGVPDKVQFKRGKVTARLVIHELGHIINDSETAIEKPIDMLARFGVVTPSGKMVTGPGRGGYQRHAGRYSPHNGYLHTGYPWQIHSKKMRFGNSAIEDFADMLLAWALGEFADNEAGDALDAWVTDYMVRRLAPCGTDTE